MWQWLVGVTSSGMGGGDNGCGRELVGVTSSGMGGGDNGCGRELVGVTSSQTEQHSPFRLMLLHLGNITIIYFFLPLCAG